MLIEWEGRDDDLESLMLLLLGVNDGRVDTEPMVGGLMLVVGEDGRNGGELALEEEEDIKEELGERLLDAVTELGRDFTLERDIDGDEIALCVVTLYPLDLVEPEMIDSEVVGIDVVPVDKGLVEGAFDDINVRFVEGVLDVTRETPVYMPVDIVIEAVDEV